MKKSIAVFTLVFLMMSNVGCKSDINSEINKRFENMQSYTATVNVTVLGNGKSETYKMLQTWKAPDMYRNEITEPERMRGTISIVNSDGIWLKSGDAPAVRMDLGSDSADKEYMFLADFFADYFSVEHSESPEQDSDGKIMLNASDRGTNKNRFTQNLIIDVKHGFMPEMLQTFDNKGNEVLRVEYGDFILNAETDDSAFEF